MGLQVLGSYKTEVVVDIPSPIFIFVGDVHCWLVLLYQYIGLEGGNHLVLEKFVAAVVSMGAFG